MVTETLNTRLIIDWSGFKWATLPLNNLQQGMVLDEDVHDMNTRLLMSKGQKIAQKHIRILKIWGVSGVKYRRKPQKPGSRRPAMDDEKP
jgi:hypothetical protein